MTSLQTWVAIANCDHSGAYTYHRKACSLAYSMGLYQLDSQVGTDESSRVMEHKRKGFWQLIHNDCSFILLFKTKPCILDFKVNLPSLSHDSEPTSSDMNDAISRVNFLVMSRLTLQIVKFCHLYGKFLDRGPPELDEKVEDIIFEIKQTLRNWQIVCFLLYS